MSDRITLEAFDLEALDTDGAIREAEAAVAGDTRASFLRKAAIGGTAAIGSGVLMSGFPALADAAKPSKKQDVKILNYALTLEYLESAFYKKALSDGALAGDVLSAAKIISSHEAAHVKFLKKALGKSAVKKPSFDFGATTKSSKAFLATAVALEDTGVSAYAGQGPRIKQKPVVVAALQIHSIEARHAAHVRTLAGKNFAPVAFDKAKTMGQVLKIVKGTKFIKG